MKSFSCRGPHARPPPSRRRSQWYGSSGSYARPWCPKNSARNWFRQAVYLRRHYRGLRVPPILVDDHLLRLLRQNPLFATWPLNEVVTDRDAFFAFLQERWPIFLDREAIGEISIHEPTPQPATTALRYSGPTETPFGHGDVRVYVDNLFMEGMLQPVKHPRAKRWRGSWEITGIRTDPEADLKRRIDALLASAEESIPDETARHQDWLGFAHSTGLRVHPRSIRLT